MPIDSITIQLSETKTSPAVILKDEPIADALDCLKPSPSFLVIFVFGSAKVDEQETELFSHFLASTVMPAAENMDALLIDGATNNGVMKLLGEARSVEANRLSLLGIAPDAAVKYKSDPIREKPDSALELDSNHTHFILTQGADFGDESPVIQKVLKYYASQGQVIGLLLGGGEMAKKELAILEAKRWPVIAVQGSGRLADHLAPGGAEAGVRSFPISGSAEELEDLIEGILVNRKPDIESETLRSQWRTFVEYDQGSRSEQSTFFWLLFASLGLGVLAAYLAIYFAVIDGIKQNEAEKKGPVKSGSAGTNLTSANANNSVVATNNPGINTPSPDSTKREFFKFASIFTPLLATGIAAYITRRKPNRRWVLLRSAAESIKSEIYRYRTGTGPYKLGSDGDKTPAQILVERVGGIKTAAQQSELNTSAAWLFRNPKLIKDGSPKNRGFLGFGGPSSKEIEKQVWQDPVDFVNLYKYDDANHFIRDDGYSALSGTDYVQYRIENQLEFFRRKCRRLTVASNVFGGLTIATGLLSSLLAALGLVQWIAVSTAMVSALSTWINAYQYEQTMVKYNQTRVGLEALSERWPALSRRQRSDPQSLESLVSSGEDLIHQEVVGWAQQMQDAFKQAETKPEDKKKT